MMNDNEKKVLENSMWDLATCLNGKPNVVLVVRVFQNPMSC